jgi:S1-C subfamily serine protease
VTMSETMHAQEAAESDAAESGHGVPEAWQRKRFRICVIAVAVILAAGLGFGAGRMMGLGNTVILAGIPRPATCQYWVPSSCAFIEDDDLTAQDNQQNILQSTAPGMVHIMADGSSVGTGIVLTQSGKVLTTYQPGPGAGQLAVKYVLAGVTFKAHPIGEKDGLALLQLEGGNGRPFETITVGNSATLVDESYNSRQASYHIAGEVLVTEVGTSGTGRSVTIDLGTLSNLNTSVTAHGRTRTGLFESRLESSLPVEIGGVLVDLNGDVIGITVAESGSGLSNHGYSIPINTALAVATQIDDGNRLPIWARIAPRQAGCCS